MTHSEAQVEGRFAAALRVFHFVINVTTLAASTAVIGIDVALRYIFNAPLTWGIEATGLLLLVMVFGSMPYVWERGAHIRMELIYDRLRGIPRVLADLATAFSGALFSGFLAYQMFITFPAMRARNEGAEFLGVPHWPFALFIALIAALMTFQFLVFAVQAVIQRRD